MPHLSDIELVLQIPLTRGKCYTLAGELTNASPGARAQFKMGNDQVQNSIGLQTGNGVFSFDFNYTATTTFNQSLFVAENGTFSLINVSIKLQESCQQDYCSECFSLETCTEPEYLNLQWTNNDDGFNINYTSLPMTQTLTVKGGLRQQDYTYDEDYFTTSRGKNFPVYVSAIKNVEMWVERVPEYIHDALRIAIVHDNFTVNLVEYSKGEGGYSPDWQTPQSFLAPVIVRLREKTQDTKNLNC